MAFRTNKTPVLQTKSASGAVATFNTALAMPLASCNIALTATQSGSGTPSPDNVRTINGWDGQNIYHSGADTSNPNIEYVAFGSTIYGGNRNARTGVLTVTHGIVDLSSLNWEEATLSTAGFAVRAEFAPRKYGTDIVGMCDSYDFFGSAITTSIKNNIQSGQFAYQSTRSYIWIRDDRFSDTESLIASLSGKYLVYELATPQTIQLLPCPIDTLEGVNNIWADTGDIDLTYKDLDIAKRGNFREVFRLPS